MSRRGDGVARVSVRERTQERPPLRGVAGLEEVHDAARVHPRRRWHWCSVPTNPRRPSWVGGHPRWIAGSSAGSPTGRERVSGGRNPMDLEYSDVVDGYVNSFRDASSDDPQSSLPFDGGSRAMCGGGGSRRDLVAASCRSPALAPANAPLPAPTILSDDGRVVTVVFGLTGVQFTIDRYGLYAYEDAYIYQEGIANSRQFNREHVARLRAGLVGMPPRLFSKRLESPRGFPRYATNAPLQGSR